MKFYLSSRGMGNETEKFKSLVPKGKIGYISNALDFSRDDLDGKNKSVKRDIKSLSELGFDVSTINLRDYFYKNNGLREKIENLGAIFIRGGNIFVLRQAMKLSKLDKILEDLLENDKFLYSGYSAAGCVLSPDLKVYGIVDVLDKITPYKELKEIIWEGLGFIDFVFIPHWQSNHPESANIEKVIVYCKKNNISYKAIRDGEVIIIE